MMTECSIAVLLLEGLLCRKKEDHGAFTSPCTIRFLHFAKALYDLSATINLMPLSIYKKLGLGDQNPTMIELFIANRTLKYSHRYTL